MQSVAIVVPRAPFSCSLERLSDGELLACTRRLVGRSNVLLAELLAHLGEVEARGIHRSRACSSLYSYCVYELRFSEDEAFRRVAAARLVRRFPALLDAVASGELHLTGLLLLGPHFTHDNLAEVLARAKYRSKREILRLVRVLDPLPPVPARIEPLGPAPAQGALGEPSWQRWMDALCPVRHLSPGVRPRDWCEDAGESVANSPAAKVAGLAAASGGPERVADAQARELAGAVVTPAPEVSVAAPARVDFSGAAPAREDFPIAAPAREDFPGAAPAREDFPIAAPARVDSSSAVSASGAMFGHGDASGAPAARVGVGGSKVLAPELFKVQFTASEEFVRLVEQAMALLSHVQPKVSFEELQLRAMRAFVKELSKKRFGASGPRSTGKGDVPEDERVDEVEASPRRRGRYIPAGVRRAVVERDGERCTYVAASGERCAETHRLEFHHLEPFARDGVSAVSNLALRCAAHNALAAEEDFGREFVARKIRGEPVRGRPRR